jgi:hypothetical protein
MATATADSGVLKPYVAAESGEMVRVVLAGLLAGLAILLLGTLIAQGFIKPVFCASSATGICTDGGAVTAFHTAAIIIGLVVVAMFASWGIFRPLPLVVGVTLSLWAFQGQFSELATNGRVEFYVLFALLSALCYALFYWLMRLRNFPLSMLLGLLAAIGIYWTLVN